MIVFDFGHAGGPEHAGLTLPAALPEAWVVDCKAVGDGSKALLYLGRYLYRGVIQERDILRCDDNGNVTFQYRHAKTDRMAVRTLPYRLPVAGVAARAAQGLAPRAQLRFPAPPQRRGHPAVAGAASARCAVHDHPGGAGTGGPAWRCTYGQPLFVLCRRMAAMPPDDPPRHSPGRVTPPDKPDPVRAHTMH
jgi:hypothetical protein